MAASAPWRKRRVKNREIRRFRFALQDRLQRSTRRRLERQLQPRSVDGAEGARKVDDFIIFAMARRVRPSTTPAGGRRTRRPNRHRRHDRSGIGGVAASPRCDRRQGARSTPYIAVLYSRPDHQSRICYVSIEFGLKGPNSAVATACSTARINRRAGRMIALAMRVNGCRRHQSRSIIVDGGIRSCRALSIHSMTSRSGPRPLRPGPRRLRDGRGAGAVVLEEYEHAKKRGEKLSELIGYGLSGDGFISLRRNPMRRRFSVYDGSSHEREFLRGNRLYQRTRHFHAARRRVELNTVQRLCRHAAGRYGNVVDKILHRPSARRRRRG